MKHASTLLSLAAVVCSLSFGALPAARAAQIDLDGPAGSGSFGTNVTVLPNGNFVVTDPGYDAPGSISNVGAVYLCDGVTLAVITTLTGSEAGDGVGSHGVTVLSNGNYVVHSYSWNGSRGAVTWGSGATGVGGGVSAANSLVGSAANDRDIGTGAVTWGSGTTGVTGEVSAANSLVGSMANDLIGGVTALNNGNYVVCSPNWDNGGLIDAGVVTWGSGTTGVSGAVSLANSLVGRTSDQIGNRGVVALNNGNYVVSSSKWYDSRGAVTWGTLGVKGEVSAVNSLIGSAINDLVGIGGATALADGNYVVSSGRWRGLRGAVTWGSGTTGVKGEVSAANSLVGSTANDYVGNIVALNNGDYVVSSANWDNGGLVDAGAVTLGDGPLGTRGTVTAANSILGTVYNGGTSMNFAYDYLNTRLLVGYPGGNRVSLVINPLVIVIARVAQGVRLRLSGVPGRTYTIERAPTVTGAWSTLNTQTVPPSDLIQLIEYIDTPPPAGQAFYRVRQP